MARTAEELYAQVHELSENERSKLIAKLDSDSAVDDELQRRRALWPAGEVTDVDSDELFDELRARQ
ncbi:MAG TPA: hypothetical protein VJ032_14190 [Thermoanaerobaculia bacterium]|nr:hypothetical protein [Thermoanaerobaculia bacterium]